MLASSPVSERPLGRAFARVIFVAVALLTLGLFLGRWAGAVSADPATCSPAITVTNTNDSGAGSLRQATTDICSGGVITFDAALDGQTIGLTSGQLALNDIMTISTSNAITVSAGDNSRVIDVGASGVVTITGLTIRDGYLVDAFGAGIRNNGTLTLTLTTVSNNEVYYTLSGSGKAGGIANYGTMAIIDSTVRDNTLTSPNFGGDGGGVMNFSGGQLSIIRSTFTGNIAGPFGLGGGVYNNNGIVTIENSTFYDNASGAGRGGGAIANDSPGGSYGVTIVNSTIVSNTSGSASSGAGGGGILNSSNNTVYLVNTVVADNFAWFGGVLTPNDVQNQLATGGYNLIGVDGIPGQSYTWDATDQTGTVASPLDPLMGPLADNGGPTLTLFPLTNSPVLDRGTCAAGSDQRGETRPVDLNDTFYPNGSGGSCDVGAVEAQGVGPTAVRLKDISAQSNAVGNWIVVLLVGLVAVGTTMVKKKKRV